MTELHLTTEGHPLGPGVLVWRVTRPGYTLDIAVPKGPRDRNGWYK